MFATGLVWVLCAPIYAATSNSMYFVPIITIITQDKLAHFLDWYKTIRPDKERDTEQTIIITWSIYNAHHSTKLEKQPRLISHFVLSSLSLCAIVRARGISKVCNRSQCLWLIVCDRGATRGP